LNLLCILISPSGTYLKKPKNLKIANTVLILKTSSTFNFLGYYKFKFISL